MVPKEGVEPSRPKAAGLEAAVSTSSTTWASSPIVSVHGGIRTRVPKRKDPS